MPDIGRWGIMDGKGELYLSKSPYNYASNTPVNAIDPDGNLVIFINGMQNDGTGGKPEYWRSKSGRIQFDTMVMDHFNDHNSLYRDGSYGGGKYILSNMYSDNRKYEGAIQGRKDAESIIANLARDTTTGEIIETIKIVTHSMGGAYGKGYVRALKRYISKLPKEQQSQIKITLVADFDPYQGSSLKVDKDIYTQEFLHKEFGNIKGFGWLANEQEQGISDKNTFTNTGSSTDHSILTFVNDISKLQEGTYKWNGNKWICTTCNQ